MSRAQKSHMGLAFYFLFYTSIRYQLQLVSQSFSVSVLCTTNSNTERHNSNDPPLGAKVHLEGNARLAARAGSSLVVAVTVRTPGFDHFLHERLLALGHGSHDTPESGWVC